MSALKDSATEMVVDPMATNNDSEHTEIEGSACVMCYIMLKGNVER